jgi:hypothetical protein
MLINSQLLYKKTRGTIKMANKIWKKYKVIIIIVLIALALFGYMNYNKKTTSLFQSSISTAEYYAKAAGGGKIYRNLNADASERFCTHFTPYSCNSQSECPYLAGYTIYETCTANQCSSGGTADCQGGSSCTNPTSSENYFMCHEGTVYQCGSGSWNYYDTCLSLGYYTSCQYSDFPKATYGTLCNPVPSSVCGNNIIEGNEVCDGTSLHGMSCSNWGYNSGTISCQSDCMGYITSGCSNTQAPTCFDGIQNQGETGIDCGGPCVSCQTNPNIAVSGYYTDHDESAGTYRASVTFKSNIELRNKLVEGYLVSNKKTYTFTEDKCAIQKQQSQNPLYRNGYVDFSANTDFYANFIFSVEPDTYDVYVAVYSQCNPGATTILSPLKVGTLTVITNPNCQDQCTDPSTVTCGTPIEIKSGCSGACNPGTKCTSGTCSNGHCCGSGTEWCMLDGACKSTCTTPNPTPTSNGTSGILTKDYCLAQTACKELGNCFVDSTGKKCENQCMPFVQSWDATKFDGTLQDSGCTTSKNAMTGLIIAVLIIVGLIALKAMKKN